MAAISKYPSRTSPAISRIPSRHYADLETILLVQNVHCPSCVSYVQDVLSPFADVTKVDVSILSHEVRVRHTVSKPVDFAKALIDAAFDVDHVSTYSANGQLVDEFVPQQRLMPKLPAPKAWSNLSSKARKQHIANCDVCKAEESKSKASHPKKTNAFSRLSWQIRHHSSIKPRGRPSSEVPDVENQRAALDTKTPQPATTDGADETPKESQDEPMEYEVKLSIEGMTCASCSGKITEELEALDFVQSVNVILLSNSGTVRYRGSRGDTDKLVEAIEDIGYEASVENVKELQTTTKSPKSSNLFKAVLSIEGMTCGSCIGTVTRGLEELPFIKSVNVDLVGNSGTVVFEAESNIDKILEKIDDLGYDAAVVSLNPTTGIQEKPTTERTVALSIDGMYCHHCPIKVESALAAGLGGATVVKPATVADPVLTIKYTPSPPDYTVRTFVELIQEADPSFHVTVYHPPSLEERSRRMQRREQWRILARLLFSFSVAIPTFVIGIVYMSLVPKSNSGRQWLEQPVWAGSVTRTEWALFIMTTPVMFFGADFFHTRAFKEIRALWRSSSKVPILRRFYRFGSMNLLISAGTAVAYFSSIAVLILDARSSPSSMNMKRGSTTYFDSVTFLTFFILIGKFLEAYSKAKTGDAVSMLANLRPSEAHLVTPALKEGKVNSGIQKISVDMLEVGDVVSVPHGTSPPSDGLVVSPGDYMFDESSLTGESKPVKKAPGDKVFTGAVNVGPPVQISITDIGGNSMLDQIVAVVREGQTKRAPIERVADILTGYFVPVITLLAIITFVVWVSLGESGALPRRYLDSDQGGWVFWSLEFAIAVFVVACPCGLGLAAPTALFVGGGMAAKRGILVQGGGEAFQEASRIDAIVFDKTGTLTEGGSLKVTEHEILDNENPDEVQVALRIAQAMEESSNHPIAKAIVDFCKSQLQGNLEVVSSEINEIGGQGMRATFKIKVSGEEQSYEAAIGNQRLLSTLPSYDSSKNYYADPILNKYQSLGHSTTILALRKLNGSQSSKRVSDSSESSSSSSSTSPFKPLIIFAISDPIRPSSLPVLTQLREKHKIDIHICTGDNALTAHAVASQLGIPVSNVRANCLPADKAAYINELQGITRAQADGEGSSNPTTKRKVIAFVGDGTNDTPALSVADVSIALSSGSDVAVTTASFILLSSSKSSSSSSSSSPKKPAPSKSSSKTTLTSSQSSPSISSSPSTSTSPSSSSSSSSTDLDLHTILDLVILSKRVFRRVKLNFAWAAVYNIILVPIAAGVFFKLGDLHPTATSSSSGWRLGPVWASAAMAASSVSVVLSSLALRWEGKKRRQ